MRRAGILMPVFALPSRFGCGSFGKEAMKFIDLSSEAGLKIWQILPLNPVGDDNSPYACYSSYAIDDIYISLDRLYEKGLIKKAPSFHRRKKRVDFQSVRKFREPYLRQAYRNFKPDQNYAVFAYQDWAKNYAMYRAFKKVNEGKCWNDWQDDMKWQPEKQELSLKPYEDEILYQLFLQYEAYLEWKEVKQYANDHDIEIMGDIPFYVGLDSSDVWSSKKNFLLDEDGRPSFIAGVPPDYFSATGQRWGNPIYDWEYMKKDGFQFWVERLSYTQRLFDIVRVDHFRAFDTYWKIPSSCPTAIEGEWIEAPGYELFDTLKEKNPEMEIIAEDLGLLRPEVYTLRDHYDFRGMRIIQFSWNSDGMNKDKEHLIVYTGTHDNVPIDAWYHSFSNHERRRMRSCLKNMGYKEHSYVSNVIQYSLDSYADTAIIPFGDWLHKGLSSRINQPGTVSNKNWTYRILDYSEYRKNIKNIKNMIEKSKR